MSVEERSYVGLHMIAPRARGEWEQLATALDEVDEVPCRLASRPEAWWSTKAAVVDQAVAGCMACPVLDECLAYAAAAAEPFGIWGGRTPAERGFTAEGRGVDTQGASGA